MADIDFRTWPAQDAELAMAEQDWVQPSGRFGNGFRSSGFSYAADSAANQNVGAPEFSLASHLPGPIVDAIEEWAAHLAGQSWRLRRRALSRFSESFADQFLGQNPSLSDEEYESLKEIGFTCLLEKLDDGQPITDMDQAHCFKQSVHDAHRMRAESFLMMSTPSPVTLH